MVSHSQKQPHNIAFWPVSVCVFIALLLDMSIVLYSAAGPTAIIDQQFDAEQGRAVPDSPSRTALIFPSKNNYVLFDGRLGHGVLGSSSKKPRMTMLINWWVEKPQVIMCYTTYNSKIFKPARFGQVVYLQFASVVCLTTLLLDLVVLDTETTGCGVGSGHYMLYFGYTVLYHTTIVK